MSKLSIFLFLLVGFYSCAESSEYELVMEYSIDSVTPNAHLNQGQSKVVVRVINSNFSEGDRILYGYKDASMEAKLDSKNRFNFKLKSNEYAFQFYPSSKIGFKEITTGVIKMRPQTTTYISVNFKYANRPETVKKPVIYLYPEEETDVSVSIKPAGELSFAYPKYDEKWECTASPSGEITIGESNYNYLFWEAEQVLNKENLLETPGTVVAKNELVEFLESSLDQFGFNSKEKMDFITFWAPQMIQYEATEVRFILNEDCNQFAELEITPKQNNLLRLYIVWNKTEVSAADSAPPLDLTQVKRNGFTVLEWGGMEITTSNPSINLTESKR